MRVIYHVCGGEPTPVSPPPTPPGFLPPAHPYQHRLTPWENRPPGSRGPRRPRLRNLLRRTRGDRRGVVAAGLWREGGREPGWRGVVGA